MPFVNPCYCEKHVQQMRDAVVDRGLGHLLSKNGNEAMERHARGEFDPVIRGFIAISQDIVDGLRSIGPLDLDRLNGRCWICDGEAVCKCGRSSECYFQRVIPGTADGILEHCIKEGLVRKPAEA